MSDSLTIALTVLGLLSLVLVWAWRTARDADAFEHRRRTRINVVDCSAEQVAGKPQLVSVLRNVTVDTKADITALDHHRWN